MSSVAFDVNAMRGAADSAAEFLRTMANQDRLMLLCQLTEGEKCVGDLEELTGILQPTLSQQLGVLRAEGLVTTRREGKYIYYALGDPRVMAMLCSLHDLFCRSQKKGKGGSA